MGKYFVPYDHCCYMYYRILFLLRLLLVLPLLSILLLLLLILVCTAATSAPANTTVINVGINTAALTYVSSSSTYLKLNTRTLPRWSASPIVWLDLLQTEPEMVHQRSSDSISKRSVRMHHVYIQFLRFLIGRTFYYYCQRRRG